MSEDENRRKILVTGAKGFLASRLVSHYERDYEVAAPGHPELDISDSDKILELFGRERPDIVLHCAAISDVDACERDPELSRRINVDGTASLARACRRFGCRLVFMSSDQVYGGSAGVKPHREDEAAPCNVYGREKLEAEAAALEIMPETLCLRLTWMYDFPARGMKTNRNLLIRLCEALASGEPLSLSNRDLRGITYVWEVVENMKKAWNLPGGVYNFGSGNAYDVCETAQRWLKLMGCVRGDLVVSDIRGNSGRFRNLTMNTDRIQSSGIGFHDTVAGLRLCLEDYGWSP